MKWKKLKYRNWPEDLILVRIEGDNHKIHYEVGRIDQDVINKEWYLYCNKPMPSKVSVDILYDCNAHYISIDKIKKAKDYE